MPSEPYLSDEVYAARHLFPSMLIKAQKTTCVRANQRASSVPAIALVSHTQLRRSNIIAQTPSPLIAPILN